MADIIDDTEKGTITLTEVCAGCEVRMSVLRVVGLTVIVEVTHLDHGGSGWFYTRPQIWWDSGVSLETTTNVVLGTYTHTYDSPGAKTLKLFGQNECTPDKLTCQDTHSITVIAPAKGEIVELDVPASVEHGASYDITAKTKNIGSSSGTFRMQLFINGIHKSTSAQFTLAASATSTDKIPAAKAPTTGTSMDYEIRCTRVI